jgi:(p)ppGpp synthase/HD superfamily hydrolase
MKQTLLSKAVYIATNAHYNQFDRGGVPYIFHVLAVMHKLRTSDEELKCIAVLHDFIEDTNGTFKFLEEEGFTQRIIEGVRCLTKMQGESYEEYQEKVFSNRDAMFVKKQDLIHNSDLRRLNKEPTEKDYARTNRYLAFHREIENRLKGAQR